MIDNEKFANCPPEKLLLRAYALKSPEEAIDLYRDWAGSYGQQLERGLRYVTPVWWVSVYRSWDLFTWMGSTFPLRC